MSDRSRHIVMRIALGLGVLAPAAAGAAPLDELPAKRWTVVHDAPPGVVDVHARFVWLPKMKAGLVWPNLHFRSKRATFAEHAKLHFYSPADGKWTSPTSTFPKDLTMTPDVVGMSAAYLAGIDRVLVLQGGGNRRLRKTARGWLLDPRAAKWEALTDQPPMCDVSTDFNPSKGADGATIPLWGTLVYSAATGEAVSVGGAGGWGRVGKKPEKLTVGDWFYDESADPKRIRRLTKLDAGKVGEARKWYAANCGTWTFSEKDRKWSPIAQPLKDQPPGRILPACAYDAAAGKIVLFGGDDFQRCRRDTWIYDCKARTWTQADPKVSPPARAAAAMVYVADQKAVLMAGGYGPNWTPLKDVWVYELATNTWTKLAADLPGVCKYGSAAYEPESRTVLLSVSNPRWGRNKKAVLWGMKLDVKTAPKAAPPKPVDFRMTYHCKGRQWSVPLPDEWNVEANKPGDPEAGRKELAALPANTWVRRSPPMKPRARQWGKYVYDPRTHTGYAWGGGHYGYPGAEISEYNLLTNRWRGMNDPVCYKPPWRQSAGGGMPGVSFQGWRQMGTHARKSYGIDPISDTLIDLHGEVYDPRLHRWVHIIGRSHRCGAASQEAYCTTPTGLYSYGVPRGGDGKGRLRRADVAAGKWVDVATGGPRRHTEYDSLCWDAKRDRLMYVRPKGAKVWAFDLKTRTWAQEQPAGAAPKAVAGDSTYVDDLDAVMLVCASSAKGDPRMLFYKLAEKKWYAAPHTGAKVGWFANLNNSPHYDPKLKLVVRLTHFSRDRFVEVVVMRLDPAGLKLTPLE